jgi:hypothetical protein
MDLKQLAKDSEEVLQGVAAREQQQQQNDSVIAEAQRLFHAGVGGRIGIQGSFQCRDKDGKIVKVIHAKGSVPFSRVEDMTQKPQE